MAHYQQAPYSDSPGYGNSYGGSAPNYGGYSDNPRGAAGGDYGNCESAAWPHRENNVCSFVYHFTRIRLCRASFFSLRHSPVRCVLSPLNFLHANQLLILFLSATHSCHRDPDARPILATNSCTLSPICFICLFIHCHHTCRLKLISCRQLIPMRLSDQEVMPMVPGDFNPRKSAISGCG